MEKSFTLLELVVVIAIVAILSGAGAFSYVNQLQSDKLKQEKERMVEVLNLAKIKALSADPISCLESEEYGGYRFKFTDSSNFSLQECCQNKGGGAITTCTTSKSYTFANNVTKSAGSDSVDFYPVSKGSNGTIAGPFRIRSSTLEKCFDFTVSTAGAITVSDIISPC